MKTSTAYMFAHIVMQQEFTTRLTFARKEWLEDRESYLEGRWIRAALHGLSRGTPMDPEDEDRSLEGSEYEWDDGAMALVIGLGGPYAMGEAMFCGVFWRDGQESAASYLLLEQGSGRTILASRRGDAHFNHGAAVATSAAEFAALGRSFTAL